MTLYEIIHKFSDIAIQQPNVNYTGFNDVFALNNRTNIDYGVFFVTQNNHQEYQDIIQYNLNLFYIDRLQDTEDYEGQLKIQSDGMIVLRNIINTFNEQVEECTINMPIIYTAFNQKFSDNCAGIYANITIELPNNLGNCYE